MNSNFFAYGCSFTNYDWTTWADIIGSCFYKQEVPKKQFNYGEPGSGNLYSYIKLMETLSKGLITSNDIVVICWTNVSREDRFIKGRWELRGNIFSQNFYPKEFIEKYVDVEGFYIKDLALIYGAKLALEKIGCKHYFISMVPLASYEQYFLKIFEYPIMKTYSALLSQMGPNFYEFFEYNWNNYTKFPLCKYDAHPTPLAHLLFVQKYFPQFAIQDHIIDTVKEQTDLIINLDNRSKNYNDHRALIAETPSHKLNLFFN